MQVLLKLACLLKPFSFFFEKWQLFSKYILLWKPQTVAIIPNMFLNKHLNARFASFLTSTMATDRHKIYLMVLGFLFIKVY